MAMLTQIDPATVRKAQHGDHDAFSAIVNAYRAPIRDYILRSVRDPELAEDLTQDVFVRAWRALPTYAFRSQLTTWLFQVAKNIIYDNSRARKSRITTIELLPEVEPAVQGSTHEQTVTMEALWAAIGELSPAFRMPLLLRDVNGLTYDEIAESLDISLANVKWRIYKARELVQLSVAAATEAPAERQAAVS